MRLWLPRASEPAAATADTANAAHTAAAAPADDAVAAALALQAAEPLLQALEAWLGVGLDLAPDASADQPDARSHRLLTVELCEPALAPAGSRLLLPAALLTARAAPPAALRALAWPAVRFEAEVATYAEPPVPSSALDGEDAGGLLLPGAFESRWRVRLVNAALGLEGPAEWNGPGTPLRLTGPLRPAAPAAAAPRWSVRLLAPLRWPLAEALGWDGLRAASTPLEQPAAALLRRDTDAGSKTNTGTETAVRRGRIVPMLRGAGLWWDRLRTEAEAAGPTETAAGTATPAAAIASTGIASTATPTATATAVPSSWT